MADRFILLRRIANSKLRMPGVKFTDSKYYLDMYSPKGSCHLVESSMSHTLVQNCLIEL